MNSVFNIKRFWTYLKREMVFDHKLMIQVSGVVAVAIVAYLFFAKVIERAIIADFIVGLICVINVITFILNYLQIIKYFLWIKILMKYLLEFVKKKAIIIIF